MKFKTFIKAILVTLVLFPAGIASAATYYPSSDPYLDNYPPSNPLNTQLEQSIVTPEQAAYAQEVDFRVRIGQMVQILLQFVGIIFIALLLYAGYLWMTDAGSGGNIDTAKNIISRAVIGLIIIISAYGLTWFVTRRLQVATGSLGGTPAFQVDLFR